MTLEFSLYSYSIPLAIQISWLSPPLNGISGFSYGPGVMYKSISPEKKKNVYKTIGRIIRSIVPYGSETWVVSDYVQ